MFIHRQLTQAIQKALKERYAMEVMPATVKLQPTKKEFNGSHTLVTFSFAPLLKESPTAIAECVGQWLTRHTTLLACYEVIGGFLNMTLSDSFCVEVLKDFLLGDMAVKEPKRYLLEIAAPNTNKPLHLGHLRNSFIGDAVASLLEKVGHEVVRMIHINDRGVHICKSMWAYAQDPNAQTPDEAQKKGDHFVGDYYVKFDKLYRAQVKELVATLGDEKLAKKKAPCMVGVQEMLCRWEKGDKETLALWQLMNGWVYEGFATTFEKFGIAFDKRYYESETYLEGKKMVAEGLEKGVFYKKEDGSVWVDLEEEGLGHKLLLRGDGTSVYMTQDLGTADVRAEDFALNHGVYVVGNEQDYHFLQLFAILKKLKRPYADKLSHMSYGMVDLPSGKMKSREGTVVDADDLLQELEDIAASHIEQFGKAGLKASSGNLRHTLAIGAIKFFLLKVDPKKRILFDPKSSIDFHGHTGPFIQYTHARISTLLEKAPDASLPAYTAIESWQSPLTAVEKELVLRLAIFSDVVHEAANTLSPALVAQYVYDLAKLYNKLYALLPILQAEENHLCQRRLFFSWHTARVLREGAALLGFVLPTKM